MRMFADREDAARQLTDALEFLEGTPNVIVLAIPNGGVPVAAHVAERLKAPLDVLLISRLFAPKHPEHVVGAVDEHGRISLIEQTARWHHLTTQQMIGPAREAFREMQRQRARVRSVAPELEVRDRTVIVVNDGVSTGALMMAAVRSVRDRGAAKVIAAAPGGADIAVRALRDSAHMVVIPSMPAAFRTVAGMYRDFPAVSDEAVLSILARHMSEQRVEPPRVRTIPARFLADEGERTIYCEVDLPPGDGPFPAVIFSHGFESDCRSIRAMPISQRLAKRGVMGVRLDFRGHGRSDGRRDDSTLATMVADLRLVHENLLFDERVNASRIGICGAGLGGMAALLLASEDKRIGAIVARGPVCGGEATAARDVDAPTLLIHAEDDAELEADVAKMAELLPGTHHLLRVPECNRYFNDPISLELMVNASVDWLVDHLKHGPPRAVSKPEPTRAQIGDSNAPS